MSSSPRLTPADLDRLESLLSAPHLQDSMTLDAIQGLLCAVASAPAPIAREKWVASVMGDSQFANEDEAKEVTHLLTRFHADTVRELAEGFGLDLITYPPDEGEEELAIWCEGYLAGVALAQPSWFEAGDDESVEDLLFPFMALSGRMKEYALESGEPWHGPEAEARLMKEARDTLLDDILGAHDYWFESRINRVPQKREAAKTGRNDPCPCGSGKKYKSCCGAG